MVKTKKHELNLFIIIVFSNIVYHKIDIYHIRYTYNMIPTYTTLKRKNAV